MEDKNLERSFIFVVVSLLIGIVLSTALGMSSAGTSSGKKDSLPTASRSAALP